MPGSSSLLSRVARVVSTSVLLLCLGACDFESRVARGNALSVMHIALGGEPQTLDPHVASGAQEYFLITALMEPLVSISPETLTFTHGAAERWDLDEDGLGATFFLRRSARWSNGDTVRAQDFVFAWRRAINPRMGNQLAEVFFPIRNALSLYSAGSDDFSSLGVRALDDFTLRIELEYPLPREILLLNLAHASAVPLHEATLRKHGAEAARYSGWARPGAIVTNGPFRLDTWRFQRDVRVSANPYYWDAEAVALKEVVFHPVTSLTTQEKLFRSGQLHLTSGLPPSKVSVYREVASTPLVNQPVYRSEYLAVNLQRSPLDDRRVRRALALAIDREALAKPVFKDAATPTGRYLPADIPGYDPPALSIGYAPDEARRLLREAGYPGGDGFPQLELLAASGETGRSLSTAVMQMWRDVLGISVQAANQEYQVYLDSLVGGNFDLVLAGWSGGVQPSGFLDRWVTEGATNDSRFSHPDFDRLIETDARSTADLAALMGTYRSAEEILLTELPLIPLFQRHDTFLKQPSIEGMPINTLGIINLKEVSLTPMEPWQPTARDPRQRHQQRQE